MKIWEMNWWPLLSLLTLNHFLSFFFLFSCFLCIRNIYLLVFFSFYYCLFCLDERTATRVTFCRSCRSVMWGNLTGELKRLAERRKTSSTSTVILLSVKNWPIRSCEWKTDRLEILIRRNTRDRMMRFFRFFFTS